MAQDDGKDGDVMMMAIVAVLAQSVVLLARCQRSAGPLRSLPTAHCGQRNRPQRAASVPASA
eukprot:7522673-Pyramimonas_sp.AAC.2